MKQDSPAVERSSSKIWAERSFAMAWIVCGVLFLWRLFHTISFHLPSLTPTSGCEEEALFSIWKFTQGQPIYNDPLQIPFSVSSYNWGFYIFYGVIGKFFLNALHLEPTWLATICRIITLSFGLASCGLFALILQQSPRAQGFWSRPLLILLCFAPLISLASGYWVMTTRPDVDAITFELAGIYFIFRHLRTGRLAFVFFAAAFFYAAWSFKHANISAIGGSCLALLLLRDWRALFIIVGLWLSAVVLTLIIGGSFYRFAVFGSQVHLPFLFKVGAEFSFDALTRDPFLLVYLPVAAYLVVKTPWSLLKEPEDLTLVCLMFCALFLGLATISKVGSGPYYFIPLGTWSLLFFLFRADRLSARTLQIVAILALILTLRVGVLNLVLGHEMITETQQPFQDLTKSLAPLPGPVFVSKQGGNLPWFQTKPPYFVITAMYGLSKVPLPYADGGRDGLIQSGYFNTIAIEKAYRYLTLPKIYQKTSEDKYFEYYKKVGPPIAASNPAPPSP
jgi:hypothetical protein